MSKRVLGAVFSFFLISTGTALADGGPSIQEEVLSECYVLIPPALQQSVTGAEGNSDDSNNPCYTGYYAGQTLDFDYRTRDQVLLVIATQYGPPTTQQIVRELPQSLSFAQPSQCETREQFAAEALTYFNSFYNNEQVSVCK